MHRHRRAPPARGGIPSRFWVFAAFAVLYGICETLNGNWSQLDMTSELGASTTEAAVALTAFWAMVTVGRVVFAAIERWVPSRLTYRVLPFLLAGTSVLIGFLSDGDVALGVVAFGLAGLGCSRSSRSPSASARPSSSSMSAAAAGGVIAFYQVGYGLAAFGVGPLLDHGVELPTIYRFAAVAAGAMGLISFVIAPSGARGHRCPSAAGLT